MQFRVWMFITILVYFYSMSVGSCSYYIIRFHLYKFVDSNDHLYNEKPCKAWSLNGNSCDPQFNVQIFGKNNLFGYKCYIASIIIPVYPDTRKINSMLGSTVSTSCNLSVIFLRVTVKDKNGHSPRDNIALFHKYIHSNQFSHYSSSGFMDNVYSNRAKLSYTIGVSCSSHYYGDKCDKYCIGTDHYYCNNNGDISCYIRYYGPQCDSVCRSYPEYRCDRLGKRICSKYYHGALCDKYCKRTDHYNCSKNGNKLCHSGYYGPHCDTVCRPSPKYRCDRFGKRICKKYYHGALCYKYCKRTDHYNCSKYGNKLCHSGYYGPQCDTACRPSPKYRCDRLGKRICNKYYHGALCDKYCKLTIKYRCDKNGDKICHLQCGPHGKCTPSLKAHFQCICNTGWKGKLCNIQVEKTTSASPKKSYTKKQKTNPITSETSVKQFTNRRITDKNKINAFFIENRKNRVINDNKNSEKILMKVEKDNEMRGENVLSLLSNVQPISMIIIFLSVILCFCLIALVVIKKKANNSIRQSTPVVIYQRKNSASDNSSKNDCSGPYSAISSQTYGYVSIDQTENGNKKITESKYSILHNMDDTEPRFNHNSDDTCTIQTCISEDPFLIPANEK